MGLFNTSGQFRQSWMYCFWFILYPVLGTITKHLLESI